MEDTATALDAGEEGAVEGVHVAGSGSVVDGEAVAAERRVRRGDDLVAARLPRRRQLAQLHVDLPFVFSALED